MIKIGKIKIDFFSNGKKHNWGFWHSLLYFFFAKLDPLDGLHIKAEGSTYANLRGKILSRKFYTFRAFYAYCRYMPFYYLRKNAEKFALRLGLPKELAYQIGAIAWVGADTGDMIEGGVSTNSFSYTVGSGSNLCLMVGSGYADSNYGISGITYNSVSLTEGVSVNAFTYGRSFIHYLVNPATGANTLATTFASTLAAGNRGGQAAVTYSGVLQTGTIGITGTNSSEPTVNSLDITFTTQTANSWIFSNYWWGGGGDISPGQGETHRVENATAGIENGSGDKTTTTAGSYTTGWDSASANSVIMSALEFKEAAAVFVPRVLIF